MQDLQKRIIDEKLKVDDLAVKVDESHRSFHDKVVIDENNPREVLLHSMICDLYNMNEKLLRHDSSFYAEIIEQLN